MTAILNLDAVFRIVIQADIQRVWRELTKTERSPRGGLQRLASHAPAWCQVVVCRCGPASGKHVLVVGEVVEFDPPHRFVHSHRFTQYDDPVCQVAYELKPVATGVEVTLRVSGMPVGTRTAKSMQQGGDMILKTLKAIAETGRPPLGTRLMYAAFGLMEFVLPKRTRSEHWPL